MLSVARRAASAGGKQLQKRRCLSSVSEPATANRRLVVSRRVWREHEKTLPKQPKPKKENPDDKPWPRNVQLAGYAVASIFIPYSTVWLITSNPSLREMFQGIIPFERLRKHFGEEEWDALSYVDIDKEEELSEGYYQFPLEPSYSERQQQETIEAFDETKIAANLYVLGDDGSQQQVKELPASTRATRSVLADLVGATDAKNIAVDFVEEDSLDQSPAVFGDTLSYEESGESDPVHPILKSVHTFSSWHHVPSQQGGQQESALNADLEIPRLEYVIDDLEKKLKDPTCTRDIDDMVTELNQAKKDLRRLKWKRRLGW